jgi:hypothetical protein
MTVESIYRIKDQTDPIMIIMMMINWCIYIYVLNRMYIGLTQHVNMKYSALLGDLA